MWRLLAIAVLASGCYSVGLSPKELCARDEMVFAGRSYANSVSDTGDASTRGIECRRPQTDAERCEVNAALASFATKTEMCPDGSRCRLGKGDDCGARENADNATACKIEQKADEAYAKQIAMCGSAPNEPKTVGQLP